MWFIADLYEYAIKVKSLKKLPDKPPAPPKTRLAPS
jgi:hypothetical protein